MKRPHEDSLASVEARLLQLVEARRAERLIKLYWLRTQVASVYLFLRGLRDEVSALRAELDSGD